MQNNNSIMDDVTPMAFYLSQNYPNPFREKTVIKYCVAYKSRVQISVYSTEGEEIEKLVDEEKNPGTYEVEFNTLACHSRESLPDGKVGRNLQGYYYYKMVAGDFTSEKKWLCINKLSGRFNMKNLIQTSFFFLLVSQICFAQWMQLGLGDKAIKDIAARNSTIFVVASDSGKLYRSTDNGSNWSSIFELGVIDIDNSPSGDVFMVKDSIYNSGPPQLFRSSNAGSSWIYLNVIEQLADSNITSGPHSVKISPMGTILCTIWWYLPRWAWGTGIAISTDNGVSWQPHFLGGMIYDFKANSVITVGDIIETQGSSGREICLSDDGGAQWTCWAWSNGGGGTYGPAGLLSLCSNGNILAGVSVYGSGIILSEDTCGTWTQVSTVVPSAGLSLVSGGALTGTDSLGVFLFSDDGDSLGSRNDGLTNLNIHSLTIDNNNYVYAGTDNGVWRRPLLEITSVEEEQTDEIPTEFWLSQNYPNPFNPQTSIQYAVSNRQFVSLKVYDILGNEIETLVNEEKPKGSYEVTWHAANLPSGVYFYQLKAGSYVETKKMILMK